MRHRAIARCAMTVLPALLSACMTAPFSAMVPESSTALWAAAQPYRCEQAEGFQVTFSTDSAVMTGPRGRQELLRDAGGLTPQQTVYSNAVMRAEFGLGPEGREAVLRTVKPATVLRCVRR